MVIAFILASLAAPILLTAYICYRLAFYAPPRKPDATPEIFPEGDIYVPYHDAMRKWAEETAKLPHEDICITSFDGLKLWATFYEYAPGAPIELMFHGYRGNPQRDLSGGVQRCFQLKRSAFLVDQRCGGRSQGTTITFGVKEHRDCLSWLDYMQKRFGPDAKILLTGISMGASTVLMAAGEPLPDNVIGVLADCGYSSARDIIRHVIRQMGLPVKLAYPFVKLGARLYGGFRLEERPPCQALKTAKVPVLFIHGQADDFVPCDMSRINYEACASPKKQLVTVPGAGHGLSFPKEPETYLQTLRDFFGPDLSAAE